MGDRGQHPGRAAPEGRIFGDDFFLSAPIAEIGSAGVLAFSTHPSLDGVQLLLGFNRGKQRWETFGGARDPWPRGEGGMESVTWTAARELCEETESVVGGSVDGVKAVNQRLKRSTCAVVDRSSRSLYTTFALRVDYNNLLPALFAARPQVLAGASEMERIRWFSVEEAFTDGRSTLSPCVRTLCERLQHYCV